MVVLFILLMMLSGVGLMVATMFNRRRYRELEHRERLAMIERGLIPSPERNPAAFESAAGLTPPVESRAGAGYRTAGVLMIGVGLGLLILISFAAHDPSSGFGFGGAFATLGAASLLNYSLISRREEDRDHLRWAPPPRREPPQGPS
jgi:hypothetical protein